MPGLCILWSFVDCRMSLQPLICSDLMLCRLDNTGYPVTLNTFGHKWMYQSIRFENFSFHFQRPKFFVPHAPVTLTATVMRHSFTVRYKEFSVEMSSHLREGGSSYYCSGEALNWIMLYILQINSFLCELWQNLLFERHSSSLHCNKLVHSSLSWYN